MYLKICDTGMKASSSGKTLLSLNLLCYLVMEKHCCP